MARAMTAGELAAMRTDAQFSKLYLSIYNPATVFAARVNQTFTTYDKLAQITFDTVTAGAYTDIKPGQTVWIGSSAGAYDVGQARVRKAATSTVLYIGETSELGTPTLPLADNQYITVVNEFGIWPRHLVVKRDMTFLMDYDVAYTNQHTVAAPVPVLGPTAAVLWLTGATVTFSPTAADSWCVTAGSKTYVWTATGASATANMTTATPTITYDTAGVYVVSCAVTVAGVAHTGYRVVFVHSAASMPVTQFTLDSLSGSWDSGGWTFDVTLYDEADRATVRDRALVVLHAQDYYGTTAASYGPISGYENIVAIGWIDGETLTADDKGGKVSFTVAGPQAWLNKITGFPHGQEAVSTAAQVNSWTEFNALTVDKSLWHLLHWRSTATNVIDIYPSNDTRRATALEAPTGSLWNQITVVGEESIFLHPCCDRYGRLFLSVDPQLVPNADRSTYPTVMTVTKADVSEAMEITRSTYPKVGRVDLSGVAVASPTNAQAIFSLSNGHVFRRYGEAMRMERMLLSTQAQANTLAGLVMAKENLEYEFTIPVAANNRMVDIVPAQYIALSVATGDTPRELAISKNAFVRDITARKTADALLWEWRALPETFPETSVNGDIPVDPGSIGQIAISIPPLPPIPPPPTLPTLPIVGAANLVFLLVDSELGGGIYYTNNFLDTAPIWYPMNVGLDTLHVPAQIAVTRAGVCYAFDTINIYRAPYPGAPWEIIADEDDLIAAHGPGTWYWLAMGVDTYGGALAAHSGAGFLYGSLMWYASDGATLASTIATSTNSAVTPAMLSYGEGKWRLSHIVGLGNDTSITILNSDCTSQLAQAGQGTVATGYHHAPAENGSFFNLIDKRYDNNDLADFDTITYPGLTSYDTMPQRVSCDPTGQYVIMSNGINLYTSADYGATWTTLTSPSGEAEVQSAAKVLDANRWILSQRPGANPSKIYYTANAGTSWTDKTGNLLDLVEATDQRFIPLMIATVPQETI